MIRSKYSILLLILLAFLTACQTPDSPDESQSSSVSADPLDNVDSTPSDQGDRFLDFYQGHDDASQALDLVESMDEERTQEEERLYLALLLTNQRLDDAAIEGDRLMSLYPDDMEIVYMRALAAHQLGDSQTRDNLLDFGLETEADHGNLNLLKANLLVEGKNYSQANRHLAYPLQKDPNDFQALILKAHVLMHLGQGNDDLNEQFLQEAVRVLDRAESVQPNYPYIYIDRARVLSVLGETGRAFQDLTKAIELQPEVEWHYIDRARLTLKYRNDPQQALEDLKIAESISPKNFLVNVYLGGIYFDLLDFEQSLPYFQQVLETRPDYYFAYETAGTIFYNLGYYQEAKEAFLKSYDSFYQDTGYILMASLAMMQLGQKPSAEQLLTQIARGLERDSLEYEMVRFFIEGGSDFFILQKIQNEENEKLRRRYYYYLGEFYTYLGSPASAGTCFNEASQLTMEYEGRASQWHLQ